MDNEFAPGRVVIDIGDFLKCPICDYCVFPPVRVCETGYHAICACCYKKSSDHRCPLCRGQMEYNKAIDNKLREMSVTFSCHNSHEGCKKMLRPLEMCEHLKQCDYRPYVCNVDENCTALSATTNALVEHWKVHGLKLQKADVDVAKKLKIEESFEIKHNQHNYGIGGSMRGFVLDNKQRILRMVPVEDGLCVFVLHSGPEVASYNSSFNLTLYSYRDNEYAKIATFWNIPSQPLREHSVEEVTASCKMALLHWTLLERLCTNGSCNAKIEVIIDL